MNLARYCIARSARQRPGATALCFAEQVTGDSTGPQLYLREYSFAQLESRVLAIAAALSGLDAQPGDRALVRLGHSPEFAFAFFGAIAAGLVAVPVSPQLTAAEVDFLIADARPALIFYAADLPVPERRTGEQSPRWIPLEELLDMAQTAPATRVPPEARALHETPTASGELAGAAGRGLEYAATLAEDPAFLVYTSGTTGRPKGVLHAQRSAAGRRPMLAGWSGLGPGDRLLHAGQLNWTYSLGVGLMDPWAAGAAGLLYAGPPGEPTIWARLIDELQATIFAAVPSLYRRVLKYTEATTLRNLPTLRHGLTAGEALTPELHAAWTQATGTDLYEALGMSEISTYISSGPQTPTRPGSPGRAQPGRRVAILKDETEALEFCGPDEAGLLAVHRSDPGLMLGYWNRPEEESSVYYGEWFAGGDRASIDADGYVRYLGRRDEVMNASGYRVSPLEVERALATCPIISEVAVCEISPAPGIQVIAAFVVPADSALLAHAAAVDAESSEQNETRQVIAGLESAEEYKRAILAFAAEHLAAYKRPREIYFRAALPRTANGKVIRNQLRPD
ncbi:MAG: acyl-CoA synthetase [bacterium]|nr:acyl-CoA synthetase [bacterium]